MADGNTFYLKVGDDYPAIYAQLTDGTGTPINLTGCTVQFRMSIQGAGNTMIQGNATIVTPQSGGDIGKVFYTWQAGDTAEPGTYLAEWKVTFPDARIATFPRGDQALVFNQVIIQNVVD